MACRMRVVAFSCWIASVCCGGLIAGEDAPRPPAEAAAAMTLPEGFQATLFAGEPDIVQPIAFTHDDRGRVWVVESFSYPQWTTDAEGHDRVTILEDTDGDGQFDRKRVFWDKGANLSGIEVGFGGVWLCATPNLLFVPDLNQDDQPDGPARIVLDGWDLKAKHNVFAALTWGPDGWLYGCNGILSNSKVGKPRTPDAARVSLNCGVWRYHPTREVFEAVASGTTNPWGLDFDDHGQMFITNCVIHHLWHVVPGAHLQRMFGQDISPHSYELMTSCADHLHWAGGPWQESRGNRKEHDVTGGGHAHAGAMVYLGDNWPAAYRNHILMCNIHGSRVNQDVLERRASGYVAHHGADLLVANDPWFRGLTIRVGPEGAAYVSDWCDTGECHDYDVADRRNGRIYRVAFGNVRGNPVDLQRMSDRELVELQLHRNDWHVRHARRILQERAAAGKLAPETQAALQKQLREQTDVTRQLRALWCLHVTGGLTPALLRDLLQSSEEHVRYWALQLECEDGQVAPEVASQLVELASQEPSGLVRLGLASVLQRLPADVRWPVLERLAMRGDDAEDSALPLMYWYALEPLVAADPGRAVKLLSQARIPRLREFVARRLAAQTR